MKRGSQRGSLDRVKGTPDRWRFRLTSDTHPNGRPRVLSRTFRAPNITAARKIATEVLHEWDQLLAEQAKATGTVAELVAAYEAHRAKRDSPSTINRRRSILARIRRDLGGVQLARLDARRIDAWLSGLGLSPPTAHHYFRTLKAILAQGFKWRMIPANPALQADPPEWRKTDTAPTMPQVADVQAMMALASPTVRLAILLAVTTGMRRGELMGLRWHNVDLERGLMPDGPPVALAVVHVRQAVVQVNGKVHTKEPKTAKGRRSITIPEVTRQALLEHRERQAAWIVAAGRTVPLDGPVLAHLRADPTGRTGYTPDWLSQEWERLRAKIGRPELQLKGLRALHASILAEGATSPAALAKRQGHAQVSTTLNYYTHTLGAADATAADVIGKALEQ